MNIEQVSTSPCETTYRVQYKGATYDLRLWIIVGGTPALCFADYKGPAQRYPKVEKWSFWDKGRKAYLHQDVHLIQGPTFDVLPDGIESVEKYLEYAMPEREFELRQAEREHQISPAGLPPRYKWEKRKSEVRTIQGKGSDDDIHIIAKSLSKTLRGLRTKDGVRLLGVVIGAYPLREIARIFKDEHIHLFRSDDRLVVESWDRKLRLQFNHGAGDRYRGLNGYNAKIEVCA
jgi:hypothetical protein